MSNTSHVPKAAVADAVKGNWVDRSAPEWAKPYLRLSRVDRPVGTWLLLLPCWWGLALAAAVEGFEIFDLWIAAACAVGAILMRGAGCTWNDYTDRDFDAQVERTRSRPLPSGQVSPKRALIWTAVQCLISFGVLLTFTPAAIVLGILALAPVAIYPFAKRFTWWPQVFLGIAINWGILLAWVASGAVLNLAIFALYGAGIAWTLMYDTIYAHQDREDDALIGVKSTARLFGARTKIWLAGFAALSAVLMGLALWLSLGMSAPLAYGAPALFAAHMAWQIWRLDTDNPDLCLMIFRSNKSAGLIPVLFFACALWL